MDDNTRNVLSLGIVVGGSIAWGVFCVTQGYNSIVVQTVFGIIWAAGGALLGYTVARRRK